ncbi:5-hydroxytryptamine receptor 3A-like [Cyclopterus lumpus]|uniref:5-hydroxytryptamine receptor 3A-like n=1 Tax=Cyclopterus lumpus TaxID=8103 RepID=UPI001486F098|nr:5-hydroxytryptamine receptor 3A-like [Cyclopterus lumpus]
MLNCSRPDTPSLLEALQPVFNLSSIRPVMNLSTPTNVSIDFTIYSILGVDEKTHVLKTYIWQILKWRNEFVKWDPEQCGSSQITIPRKLLWVPDMVINEFMEKNSAPFVPYSYLFSDGLVIDYQPVKVISSCKLDIYKFPFDIQNCSLSFNSYLHRQTALQIDLSSTVADILKYSKEVMTTMGEWELVGLTVNTYLPPAGNEDVYEEMRFFVSVKRRATLYVVNLLIPSCFLVMVDLFSFLLPPQNVDRSLFKMTLILGYTVFLLIMNDLLPASGNTVPLISVFLCLCLALMVASLLETILITNLLYGSAHYPPVPCWFRVFVLHILGRLVWLPPKPRDQQNTVIRNPAAQEMKVSSLAAGDSEVSQQKGPLDKEKAWKELRHLESDLQAIRLQVKHRLGEGQGSEEWIQVGSIIDRLLLSLYIIFISVSFITITTIWMQSYNTS